MKWSGKIVSVILFTVSLQASGQDSLSLGIGYRAFYTEIAAMNKNLDDATFEYYKTNETGAFSQSIYVDVNIPIHRKWNLDASAGYAQVNYRSFLFESQLPDPEVKQFRYIRKADYVSVSLAVNYRFAKHWYVGLGAIGNVHAGARTIVKNWDTDDNLSKEKQETPFDYAPFWMQGQLQIGYENTVGAFRYRIAPVCAVGFGAWTENESMDYRPSQFGLHLSLQRKL